MKKLLFFHHYNSSVGAGLCFLHILRSIDKSKYDVTVCLPIIKGDLDKKVIDLGYKVIYSNCVVPYMHYSGSDMKFLSLRNIKNINRIASSKKGISELITEQKPDIVAVNSLTLFWIGKVAKSCGVNTVCFNRETYDKGLFGYRDKKIKKELKENFDYVVFLSYYDLNQTPKGKGKYIRITDKVDVHAYGKLAKCDCRKELDLPLDEKLLLYTGGIAKLKGAHVLLKALSKTKTDFKVVFLQYNYKKPSSAKQKAKSFVKTILCKNYSGKIYKLLCKLNDKVILRGATDCVEKYFVACDAVVFPSTKAHQARPAYEAGVARKPLIITDFINTREFANESNAWLFSCGDYKALAKHIDDVFGCLDSAKVTNNYNRALKENNLDDLSNELNLLFDNLC